MTYRYIYIIICTHKGWEGKFYIGQRHYRGKDPYKDKYTGSGILIRRYLEKYPNEYLKIILDFYETDAELNKAEYEYIHPYLHTKNCLNLMEGGSMTTEEGKRRQAEASRKRIWTKESCDKISKNRSGIPVSEQRRKDISNSLKGNSNAKGHTLNEQRKKEQSERMKGNKNMLGYKRTKEYVEQMADKLRGRKYMTDGINRVYIEPEYWGEFIDIGYHFGLK